MLKGSQLQFPEFIKGIVDLGIKKNSMSFKVHHVPEFALIEDCEIVFVTH